MFLGLMHLHFLNPVLSFEGIYILSVLWIKYKFQLLNGATDEVVGDMNEVNFLIWERVVESMGFDKRFKYIFRKDLYFQYIKSQGRYISSVEKTLVRNMMERKLKL